ncbi:hypothetical protein KFE25_012585 [Diacronema lutheri]|uniref:4Fe-4S ferredoxin-type domain-containing protein n=2 Tax=Diacronema lutheri TaxID=2081491 RepID=A0A8J5XJ35_DIALT|nr:hypothetical protein KFE25_012585 [Diacronema lutheri]
MASLTACAGGVALGRPSSLDLSAGLARIFYVDEPTCIGCTRCAKVAPRTFAMEAEWGRARVVRQGGDEFADVREAIRTCPAACIHQVTAGELAVLEQWREANLDGVQRAHATSRLVGASTPPAWWLPLRQAGTGSGWHPIIADSRAETKATIDFMGTSGAGDSAEDIALEDALELKHELPPGRPLKSRADMLRVFREHRVAFSVVAFMFTLQGVEILSNDVHC